MPSLRAAAFKLTNDIADVFSDISKEEKKLRAKAAQHIKAKIKAKIRRTSPSLPGEPPGKVTGNLLKGLGLINFNTVSIVGFKKPGFHAHLLEFGTDKMQKRPFLFPTFAEESRNVRKILSEEWIK